MAIGGGDGACTARGAGVSEPGDAYCYIGSSAWVSQIRPAPVFDPEARIFNYLDMDGASYHVCGTVQCRRGSVRLGAAEFSSAATRRTTLPARRKWRAASGPARRACSSCRR